MTVFTYDHPANPSTPGESLAVAGCFPGTDDEGFRLCEGGNTQEKTHAENRKRICHRHSARSCSLRGSIRARRRCRRCWRGRGWLIIRRRRKQRKHGPDESGYCGQRDIWSRRRRHVGNVRNEWRWEWPVRFGRFGVKHTGNGRQFRYRNKSELSALTKLLGTARETLTRADSFSREG